MSLASATRIRKRPVDLALGDILSEISVAKPVLDEAKDRRNLVLEIALGHAAARARYSSGSVAHGSQNNPLEDTDCGIKIDRRVKDFRGFGPGGEGPERFIQMFADFVLPRLRSRGYPGATVDLDGNRAIKFEFHETVEVDEGIRVDPYVDLIVALSRDGGGLWIPNRRRNDWDLGDPELHTELMTTVDPKPLRVHRAHLLRLAKRAVKRDDRKRAHGRVMHSWNLSALALESVDVVCPLGAGLADFFGYASDAIAVSLTDDPSDVVEEPLKLPEHVSQELASMRLGEMANIVAEAGDQLSGGGAREVLSRLYGQEIDAIVEHERTDLRNRLFSKDSAAVSSVAGLAGTARPVRSDGD